MKPDARDTRRAPEDPPIAALRVAFCAVGFASLTVQTLLLRELMVAWRGNEMSFGVVLSVWLMLTGLGSIVFASASKRTPLSPPSLVRALVAIGALAPAALLAARAARGALGVSAGELLGIGPLFLASACSLAPFTVVAGSAFALAVSVRAARHRGAAGAIAEVYVFEALGAVVAGALLSFALLGRWEPSRIAFLATAVSAGAAGAVALATVGRPGTRRRRVPVGPLVTLTLAALFLGPPGAGLERLSVRLQWRELGFVSQVDSVYGRIVATETGSQRSIYVSGVLAASAPDRLAAEEAVHIAMLQHPAPGRVLLLGGGLAGAVAEVLKHPSVTAVDYVELDPALIAVARREFGASLTAGMDDPRVTVLHTDARLYVKASASLYDVVVLNMPDPTTAQLNRFYTVDFFREVEAVLAQGGLLSLAVTSSENYIGDALAEFLACIRNTLKEVFPAVVTLPGDPCHFAAARSGTELTRDPVTLAARIAARELDVVFVRDYYLDDRLSAERAAYLDESLERTRAPINTDLRPVCQYLSLVLWNRQFTTASFLQAVPRFLNLRNAMLVGAALLALLGLPALGRRGARAAFRRSVVAAILVVGATEISLEITALLSFQSLYGYVYQRLALIVAAFMAGLAFGGWLGAGAIRRGAGARSFVLIQLGICGVPVGLAAAIRGVAGLPADELASWAGLFPLIVVASAVLAGMQFPVAGRLYDEGEAGATGGRLYGADLLGSALGATAAAVFLVPVMGVSEALGALSIINAAVLVSLLVSLRGFRRPPGA